jgi:hypothetical protein
VVHALLAAGDCAMAAVLVGSVFISSPDAARSNVLLFQLISVAPFAIVAPLIGPWLDRLPGGRRFVVQLTALARAALLLLMIPNVDSVLLFPLVFGMMVLQKTYSVSKSALVPLVVRTDEELVEANSKLGVIAGVVAAIAVGPLTGLGHLASGLALVPGAALFVAAALNARLLPRDPVTTGPVREVEKEEMRSIGILVAAGGMALIRASVGFLTFHLLFFLRGTYGLGALGVAIAGGALGSVLGNIAAPAIRRRFPEELMLIGALTMIAVTGLFSALIGGLGSAVVLSFAVNASASIGRMAFESIVQRDAPDANQGRVFAQYESRFQLSWVLAGVIPVLFTLPGQIGYLIVGLIGVFGTTSAVVGARAARAGRPLPPTLTARARQTLRKEVDRRRRARTAGVDEAVANLPPGSPLPPPKPGQKRR